MKGGSEPSLICESAARSSKTALAIWDRRATGSCCRGRAVVVHLLFPPYHHRPYPIPLANVRGCGNVGASLAHQPLVIPYLDATEFGSRYEWRVPKELTLMRHYGFNQRSTKTIGECRTAASRGVKVVGQKIRNSFQSAASRRVEARYFCSGARTGIDIFVH
jgi:hypothetical protein